MLPLIRIQFLSVAAAGALVALTAGNTSVRADELAKNLGPVGPHEPILTTVGSKRVIAFYVPGNGDCYVDAVVWDSYDADARTAVRIRVNLKPGQIAHIESAENRPLALQCGDLAKTLAVSR